MNDDQESGGVPSSTYTPSTASLTSVPAQGQSPEPVGGRSNDAKRSIHYLLDAAMQYGNVGGLVDLLRPQPACFPLTDGRSCTAASSGLASNRW